MKSKKKTYKLILSVLIFITTQATFCQPTIQQSDSNLTWHEIQNNDFKILFPDFLEEKAQYTLNLLNHYRPIVGARYYSKPEKITITLRPDMASPNGFVTLAPRRSEWFDSKNISPIVGSLDWYHSLAIHEYRHIVQYDHLSKGNTKWGYYLFGEQFLGLLLQIVMPGWYFEGDAVWAETILSDAGRGRSPRFSARLKALITSNQFPNYDDLLAGDYEHYYPGVYVYGYFLIARAIQKYGGDFWVTLSEYAADRPWNPFTFTSSFLALTGDRFDDFYSETLQDIKSKWGIPTLDFLHNKEESYANNYFPFKVGSNIFYLKQDFNERLSFFKNDKKLIELNIDPNFSSVDFKNENFLYTKNNIHYRYLFKNYSDIYYYNVKTNKNIQITKNEKYFHPKWHPSKQLILAIHKDTKGVFSLHIVDIRGRAHASYSLQNGQAISQASWINNNSVAAIILNKDGSKQLALYQLNNKKLIFLTSRSKNNLYNITTHKDQIYFEADYKGATQIFQLDLSDEQYPIFQCTNEYVGASMPAVEKEISYIWESPQGKRIKTAPIACMPIAKTELFEVENYISSDNPSDNYHQKKPVIVQEFEQFYAKNFPKTTHRETGHLLKPHSWSILGDRGFQISALSQNELGSISIYAATGFIAEEGTPFLSGEFSYLKYYPLLNFSIDHANRNLKIVNQYASWTESKFDTKLILPYFFQYGFFSGTHLLSFGQGVIKVSDNEYQNQNKLNNEELITSSIGYSTRFVKNLTKQELISKWSYNFDLNYMNLNSNKNDLINYFGKYAFSLTTPAFSRNHGILFNFSSEIRPNNESLYQIQTSYVPTLSYTFSRGYAYEFTSKFEKLSLDYHLPLSYPKMGFRDWIYITQVYAKIFYDTTKVKNLLLNDRTLNSQGIEFIFDTNTMRKFPLSYGLRILHRDFDDQVSLEFFFANIFI